MSTEKSRQALRSTPVPNDQLARLIELVNLLSPETELPPLKITVMDSLLHTEAGERKFGFDEWVRLAHRNLDENLRGLPEELRQHIWQDATPESSPRSATASNADPNSWFKTTQAVSRYERYVELTVRLRGLARLVELIFLTEPPLPGGDFTPLFSGSTKAEVGDDGMMHISLDELSQAINGIDVRRIRECPICKRIFWAGRIDQKACTKEHANVYRVRVSREKYRKDPARYQLRKIKEAERRERRKRQELI